MRVCESLIIDCAVQFLFVVIIIECTRNPTGKTNSVFFFAANLLVFRLGNIPIDLARSRRSYTPRLYMLNLIVHRFDINRLESFIVPQSGISNRIIMDLKKKKTLL